ncbi:hypothetical protein C8F04DRAFT_1081231 [Mycena alexandri]|uniref:Transmembrane protein n=1 Tax=Mycena alexandri TaxID=1745969 RepID=A0AAD6T9K2_9AGAR|nr:hypothetical protein C8F04DRAFT_1081231 [Mycena alexandri]
MSQLWNFSIPGTSPIFSYSPYADGFGLQNGWQAWYTVSGFNTQPGESSVGDSFHLTSLDGAEVSLQFYGSAVYLYGTANTSYDVVLDDKLQSFSGRDGLLYSSENLAEKNHSVELTAKITPNTTQQLGFSHAVVSTSDQTPPTQVFWDNTNPAVVYLGQWTNSTIQGIPNSSVTAPFHQTLDVGAGAKMNFSDAVAIAVYASTNFGHGLYSVVIDNELPQTFNASTFWLVTDTVIFFQSGLDPTKTHTLNIINLSAGNKVTLSSIVTYQGNGSISGTATPSNPGPSTFPPVPSHSSMNVGVIVGPIVAVVLLGLIAAFFWIGLRRSRRQDQTRFISPLVLPPASEATSPSAMTQVESPRRKGQAVWLQPGPGPVQGSPQNPTRSSILHSHPSPTSTPSPTSNGTLGSPLAPAVVNQLLELIAQRIDRRGESHGSEGSSSPPEYRIRPV